MRYGNEDEYEECVQLERVEESTYVPMSGEVPENDALVQSFFPQHNEEPIEKKGSYSVLV